MDDIFFQYMSHARLFRKRYALWPPGPTTRIKGNRHPRPGNVDRQRFEQRTYYPSGWVRRTRNRKHIKSRIQTIRLEQRHCNSRAQTCLGIGESHRGRQLTAGQLVPTTNLMRFWLILCQSKSHGHGYRSLLLYLRSGPYWLRRIPPSLNSCVKHIINKWRVACALETTGTACGLEGH